MTVRRKLFLSLASFIAAMSVVYILVTVLVVNGVLRHARITDHSGEIALLSDQLLRYYEQHNDSWDDIGQSLSNEAGLAASNGASFMLMSPDRKELYLAGDMHPKAIMRLGTKQELMKDGKPAAILYYYEPEAGSLSLMRLGVSSSVTFILLVFAVLFLILSLLIAYWYSKKFTSPLRALVTAIQRLGKGELGTQTPVTSRDEYGVVAQTFNAMSVQLKRSEEVRRNLVADVAHELRTPLTILQGQMELIQQSGRSVEPEALLPLQDELIRLTRLVDDLHQLSMAESKKLTLDLKQSSITALLEKIIARLADEAAERGIEISIVNRAGDARLRMDAHRMTQVFLNLLTNAVRYTSENGTVAVQVEWEAAAESNGNLLTVMIADTGSGIAPEHLPYIFDRFYRSDEARNRNSGGMGLGLAIAKEFVLAHKGTIEAASVVGQGTVFTVRLPEG